MSEKQWLFGKDPTVMLAFVKFGTSANARRLRLLACACVGQVAHAFSSEVFIEILATAWDYADGLVSDSELERGWNQAWTHIHAHPGDRNQPAISADSAAARLMKLSPLESVSLVLWEATKAIAYQKPGLQPGSHGRHGPEWWEPRLMQAKAALSPLVRDIFGNPFQPRPTLSPSLLTPGVLALAESAYRDSIVPQGTLDPEKLLALADALQEAGCEDERVLGHLREAGAVHVRGCWVIDLLLAYV